MRPVLRRLGLIKSNNTSTDSAHHCNLCHNAYHIAGNSSDTIHERISPRGLKTISISMDGVKGSGSHTCPVNATTGDGDGEPFNELLIGRNHARHGDLYALAIIEVERELR